MGRKGVAINLIVLFVILSALLTLDKGCQVEGIFFLDLLCATRIGQLEQQVSQLVAALRNSSNSYTPPITFG